MGDPARPVRRLGLRTTQRLSARVHAGAGRRAPGVFAERVDTAQPPPAAPAQSIAPAGDYWTFILAPAQG